MTQPICSHMPEAHTERVGREEGGGSRRVSAAHARWVRCKAVTERTPRGGLPPAEDARPRHEPHAGVVLAGSRSPDLERARRCALFGW